jgi:hypothetical protein
LLSARPVIRVRPAPVPLQLQAFGALSRVGRLTTSRLQVIGEIVKLAETRE